MLAEYGTSVNDTGKFLAQILGIVVLGIAAISYLAKDVKDKTALKAILVGFVIAHVGSAIFTLTATLSGLLNQMGWADGVIHGLLAAGFGYYLTTKK